MTKAKRQTQRHKDTRFEVRKINFLTLCLFLPLCVFPVKVHARNLIYNGDFERKPYDTENLWDGVDNSGRLKVVGSSAPFVADIDGDRKKDIICGDSIWVSGVPSSGMVWFYPNSGTNKAPRFTTGRFLNRRFDANVKPVAVDWNGDLSKDIVFGSANGWVCFLPKKSTGFQFRDTKFIGFGKDNKLDIGQFSAPAVADWDGDGKKDLILGEGTYSANSVYIYLNKGGSSRPGFDKKGRIYLAYGEGKMHLTPSVVDWDKDGDLDLIVGDKHGYINLYMNEAGRGEVKILEYAGRLKKKNGRDVDIGSMSTPCATDWDEDGDWDIVCGNSDGLIYLVLNEGSLKKPEFAEPVVLKGTNALKDKGTPDWSIDMRRRDTSGFLKLEKRTGAYSISVDDRVPHSGKYCLKVVCHEGYDGKAVVHGRIKSPLKRGVKYKVSFYVRGKGLKCSQEVWYRYVCEKTIASGIRRYGTIENTWVVSDKFKIGGAWKKVSSTFKLPKVRNRDIKEKLGEPKMDKERLEALKKKLGSERPCYFDIIVRGDGVLRIDDVSLEEEKE